MNKENTRTGLEIAVIGIAGKFPGAKNIESFWSNLKNGVESCYFLGSEELEKRGMTAKERNESHFVNALGGIVDGIEYFDAYFFNYTPMEAEYMAPPIRIFHECLWETLEDAGYNPENLNESIGLYTGVSSTMNWERLVNLSSGNKNLGNLATYNLSNRDFIGTLASYKLNLQGPVFTMNTACSTSLTAIHLACQGLLSGDCDMALAGGIEIYLNENTGYFYEEGMIHSPDGHCRAFEARAKGTIGGEGVGLAALKRLEDALADKDNIHAVIMGSAINNDGNRKVGYTAPSVDGQAAVIRNALEMAAVSPEDIRYVEAHGTATPLGDVTEIEALKIAYSSNNVQFCALGAVKTNVGHLGIAAGITGFIKTVLVLKHRLIPPTLHFETPNPKIDFRNSPFYVNSKLVQWENSKYPRRAGVSSFGIGGTNVHVVLEEAPQRFIDENKAENQYQLILLSAKNETVLDNMTKNLTHFLNENPDINLENVAYTLQMGRKHFTCRRKFICSNIPDAVDILTSWDLRKIQSSQINEDENKPVIFMFSGLGFQYVNMGRGLYQSFPLFKKEMDQCFEILNTLMDCNIKEILYPPDCPVSSGQRDYYSFTKPITFKKSSMLNINQTQTAQLVIFIFEYALAKLLMSWGITPHAMMGYSFGEYVAACLAGVFSPEDALKLLVVRGKLLQELPPGMMTSVPLPKEDLYSLLTDELSIAIDNGASCVVSGPVPVVKSFEQKMKEKKWICIPLKSTHAIHSKMMDPILKKFEEAVAEIPLNAPKIPYISSITANWISVQDATSPRYWAKQLKGTVFFSQGIQHLLKGPESIFLEVGAGHDISALLKREIKELSGFQVLNLVRQQKKDIPDAYYLLDKIGQLWLNGVSINWDGYYYNNKNRRVSLPAYPFEKRRFWKLVDDLKAGQYSQNNQLGDRENRKNRLSDSFYLPSWKQTLSPLSLISDRMVQNSRCWLIFLDECGIGIRLKKTLRQSQSQDEIITVSQGEHFSRISGDHYLINPSKKEDYNLLLDNLIKLKKLPDMILHLWGLTSDAQLNLQFDRKYFRKYQATGYYSLLFLIQSLVTYKCAKKRIDIKDPSDSLMIEIVLNNIFTIIGEEKLCAEKATILGLCKTIPQEYPNVTCRTIEIQIPGPGSSQESKLIQYLIAEFNSPQGNLTMAYRGNSRWIRYFEPLNLDHKSEHPGLLRKKGVYLITGGLGNDSFMRSKYLAKAWEARLVLTGRSKLPDRVHWRQYLATHVENDEIATKIKRILELEQMGAEVLAISADVSNPIEMRKVLQTIDEKFGVLNGVIHAAGFTHIDSSRLLMELGGEESEWHFHSKVYGLYVLEKLLEGRDIDFCLVTSSIATVIGGIGVSAYTAASCFVDAFIHRHNNNNPKSWICLNWQGASEEDTIEAFQRVLSLKEISQLVFSQIDLDYLIKEKIELKPIKDKIESDEKEITYLYPRPSLSNPFIAPGNNLEHQLVQIWQKFFGMEKIGITDDLFELGGDSLKAMNILSIIQKEFQVTIPIRNFFENSTIQWIARYIMGADKEIFLPIAPSEKKEYYVLSSNQRRLFALYQLDKEKTTYNIPIAVVLEGFLDRWKIENTFLQIIKRQEVFRTALHLLNHEPVQKIYSHTERVASATQKELREQEIEPEEKKYRNENKNLEKSSTELKFSIEYYDISIVKNKKQEIENILHSFIRPFDLSCAPLLRVTLIKESQSKHLLMMDIHHIIMDAASMGLVIKEFSVLYENGELPPIRVHYKDYSEWQYKEKVNKKLKKQEAYWLNLYKGQVPPVLNLPTDYLRPRSRPTQGNRVHFNIDNEKTTGLKELGLNEDTTLFVVVLAVYNLLLAKLSGQEDIVVGTGIEGRRHHDQLNIIGMFVNTLTMRNYPESRKTFLDFLRDVKRRVLDAFENQEYPFEDLVSQLEIERDTSRNPLFDVMFQFNNFDIPQVELPGLKLTPYKTKDLAPKFDLCLQVTEAVDQIFFSLEYSPSLFKKETIEIVADYFKEILSLVIIAPQNELSELKQISELRKKTIMDQLNTEVRNEAGTKRKKNSTLQDRLSGCFERFNDTIAIECNDRFVTYGEIDKRSRHIVNCIFYKGIKKQTFIGILINDRIEMICAIIGILRAGCVFVPLDTDFPEDRVKTMVCQVDIGFILCDNINFKRYQLESVHELIRIEDLSQYEMDSPQIQYSYEYNIYVYFTSGSTGIPKAFIGKNQSLLNFIEWEIETFNIDDDSRISQLTTPGFDAFLRDVFVPLCTGGIICIPTSKDVLLNSGNLIKWIDQSKIHLIHCIPSVFCLFNTNFLTKNHFKNLKFILLSGERINPFHLTQWYNIFAERIQLVNLWGTSETTLAKTVYFIHPNDINRERIPVGKPIEGSGVVIFDKQMDVCDHLVTGEIYILTPFRTAGYCNDPDMTADRFLSIPFNVNSQLRMHKTGDLGRFLPDGNIDLIGRDDRQVKIRGIRIELEEIEGTLFQHPQVKEAVVIKRELANNNELLCAYITIFEPHHEEKSLLGNVKEYLQAKLPGYMIPSEIITIEKIPRNLNGKIDYQELIDRAQDKKEMFVPPRNYLEGKILHLWSETLGIDLNTIGVRTNFFRLGGNSLNIMSLISKIHKEFEVQIPYGKIFNHVTIEAQAGIIDRAGQKEYIPIFISEKKECYPLSSAQTRMFASQQMEKESTAYNVSLTMIIKGYIAKKTLENRFRNLIIRHESLRTSFEFIDGKPMQRIHPQVEFVIKYDEIDGIRKIKDKSFNLPVTIDEKVNLFIRPFNLSQVPLIRVGLIKIKEQEYVLMVDLHHIITDFSSMNIIIGELMASNDEEELPPLRIQYKDFSEWQNNGKQIDNLKNQEAYWIRIFEKGVPGLNLPFDYERTNLQSSKKGKITFVIENQLLEKVKCLIIEEGVTMYIMLLSIYYILLFKLSKNTDIVIGTAVEGRNHMDLQPIVGMFVNTLALRNYPGREKTFISFLKEVKKGTLEALDNQDYQYDDLVRKLRLKKFLSKTSLFDVMFDLNTLDVKGNNSNGLNIHPYGTEVDHYPFDLILKILNENSRINISLIYSKDLFKPSSAKKYTKRYIEILEQAVDNRTIKLGDITISHDLAISRFSLEEDSSDFGF